MSQLDPVGISAWSYLNATGMAHFVVGCPSTVPRFASTAALEPHPKSLGLKGHWGRVSIEVAALPAPLHEQSSRATELLVQALLPLRQRLLSVCERYGAGRVGIVLGSSTGGIDATEHALRTEATTGAMPSDYVFEEAHVFSALIRVAQAMFGAHGPAFVVSTACSSSGKALGAAQRLILSGVCDAVLTGGVDSLSELTLRGFGGLSILSPTVCKPFDGARDGISIGEGASLLLLERDSDTEYLLAGVGEAGDAYHPTAPHPDGLGAELALLRCLEHAGLDPKQIDYVNAHGTGTAQNDQVEALVIDRALGSLVPFSSTKDRTGHQLGTAGATEAIISLMALMHGELPLNRAPERVDTSLRRQPLIVRGGAGSPRPPAAILSNSFAFGGSNVTVALQRVKRAPLVGARPAPTYYVCGIASLDEGDDPELPCSVLPARARGRASPLTRMFAELFGRLIQPEDAAKLPMFFGSAYGEMSTTILLLDQMLVETTVSPAKFQSSVHNTAAGLLSIATENRAPATAIAAGDDTLAMTLADACSWLGCHGGQALVLVADEPGPRRLLRGRTFPAFGVGLLLSTEPPRERPPLGTLSAPSRLPNSGLEGHAPADNPARFGRDLVSVLAGGHDRSPGPTSVAVGPHWSVIAERAPR